MNDYKKLTNEELEDYISRVLVQLEPPLSQETLSMIQEVLEYRTKIENKTLIELPCKAGDKVYYLSSKTIREETVTNVECVISNGKIGLLNSCIFTNDPDDKYDNFYRLSKLGKSLFLTKSEAKAKLKKLKGE